MYWNGYQWKELRGEVKFDGQVVGTVEKMRPKFVFNEESKQIIELKNGATIGVIESTEIPVNTAILDGGGENVAILTFDSPELPDVEPQEKKPKTIAEMANEHLRKTRK